jgi:chemotaxis response regulator CheB
MLQRLSTRYVQRRRLFPDRVIVRVLAHIGVGRGRWVIYRTDGHRLSRQNLRMSEQSHFQNNFPIVCVGGSAGGLDAYIRLLEKLPPDTGAAVVIVNHITMMPTQLHEVLPRFTKMPVELITERLLIEPNHVFIIPENRDLHVMDGEFRLRPISKPRGWPDVITVFLRSLTHYWEGKLIAVIVSGYDGDGAAALCAIKEIGGVTIAQRPDTAKQPDMPESAISSGCIDFVLSPEDIAVEIVRIVGSMKERAPSKAIGTEQVKQH